MNTHDFIARRLTARDETKILLLTSARNQPESQPALYPSRLISSSPEGEFVMAADIPHLEGAGVSSSLVSFTPFARSGRDDGGDEDEEEPEEDEDLDQGEDEDEEDLIGDEEEDKEEPALEPEADDDEFESEADEEEADEDEFDDDEDEYDLDDDDDDDDDDDLDA